MPYNNIELFLVLKMGLAKFTEMMAICNERIQPYYEYE
jgi:hypothetical protein